MRSIVCVALSAVALQAIAQSTDPLPASLSGRWTFVRTGSSAIIDTFSIVLDGNRAPGNIAGKLTWRGFNCGAKDEPFEGTWDGTTFRSEATVRPNVNAQRVNGTCSADPSRFVLNRKADGRTFEGDVHSGNVVVTMTASP